MALDVETVTQKFQSTRPVRGATIVFVQWRDEPHYFNPRAPCGARHLSHLPKLKKFRFQSTRPVRGATIAIIDIPED